MPLTLDDVVWSGSGSTGAGAAAASFVVNHPDAGGTTAGNTVVIGIAFAGAASLLNTPTGFAKDASQNKHYIFRKSNVGAGETSWTVACTSLTARAAWWVLEVANLDLDDPLDVSATAADPGTGVQSSGTTAANSAMDTLVLASHQGSNTASAAPTWSGQTNGFTELVEGTTSAGATSNAGIAVSYLFPGTIGPFSCTATESVTSTSSGCIVVYRSATSPSVNALAYHTGFEFGHDGGLVVGPATARLAQIAAGATVAAGSAKNGSYGLKLTASAAAANLGLQGIGGTTILPAGKDAYVSAFWIKVESATGTPIVARVSDADNTLIGTVDLVYDVATTKLGVRWNKHDNSAPGTVTYQAGTLALGGWAHVSLASWGSKTTTRKMAWVVNDGAETALANSAVATAGTGQVWAYLGSTIAATFVAHFDDWRVSTTKADHPLSSTQQVRLLTVDPAGTVTLSGTTTNFQVFTGATPTLAAWNATTARDRVDEVPPGLGASADGFAQIAAAAADYVEVPMSTYTLAAGEIVLAVRALVAGWAAGASTIGLRGFDGTTEKVLWAVADPSFNNSATAPGWLSCLWSPGGRWTQAMLNAAALRHGFGTSATDIGAHAFYLEVVIGSSSRQTLFGDTSTADYDRGWSAVTEVDIAGPSGGDTTLYYETAGTPTSVTVPADTSHTETIDAPDAATTNYIAAYWPPEGVPDA